MSVRFRSVSRLPVIIALFLAIASVPLRADERPVLVFAAASLQSALDDVKDAWTARAGKTAAISYGASSALARRIERGAPADIFISADLESLDDIAEKGFVITTSTRRLLGNKLVLIARDSSMLDIRMESGLDLASLLGRGRLAICDTAAPAGKYAKASLETLGAWQSLKPRIGVTQDVREAVALVAQGDAPFGIVYATDAAADSRVKIVGEFPAATYPPIVYPIALTAPVANPKARAFLPTPLARANMRAGLALEDPTAAARFAEGWKRAEAMSHVR